MPVTVLFCILSACCCGCRSRVYVQITFEVVFALYVLVCLYFLAVYKPNFFPFSFSQPLGACVRVCFVRFCINLSEHISYAYECKNSSLTLNCFLSSLVRNINSIASIADPKLLFI